MSQQIGLEQSPDAYVQALVGVFRDVWRVLKADGVLWLNLGDSYSGAANSGGTQIGRVTSGPSRHGAAFRQVGLPVKRGEGVKPKDLVGIPWAVAFALRADGWYLRSDIIWSKGSCMPESVRDRPTRSHEYLFLLAKQERYYYDADAIAEPCSDAMFQQVEDGYTGLGLKDYAGAGVQNPSDVKARILERARRRTEYAGKNQAVDEQAASRRMSLNKKAAREAVGDLHTGAPFGLTRNKRSVWNINAQNFSGAHFATMPEALVEPCILAGSRLGDLVCDPFVGSGTVGCVAERLGRRWVGVDLNPAYHHLAKVRTAQRGLRFEAAVNE